MDFNGISTRMNKERKNLLPSRVIIIVSAGNNLDKEWEIRLKLTVVESAGFGDQINKDDSFNIQIYQWMLIDKCKSSQFFFIVSINKLKTVYS